jgi:hypothetical protein
MPLQGKWVVAAKHPCNDFISQFHNALIYHNPKVVLRCSLRFLPAPGCHECISQGIAALVPSAPHPAQNAVHDARCL